LRGRRYPGDVKDGRALRISPDGFDTIVCKPNKRHDGDADGRRQSTVAGWLSEENVQSRQTNEAIINDPHNEGLGSAATCRGTACTVATRCETKLPLGDMDAKKLGDLSRIDDERDSRLKANHDRLGNEIGDKN